MMKVIPIVSGRTAAAHFAGGALVDTRARAMHDLRISVTDRCNFRCVYCMPREVFESHQFLPHGVGWALDIPATFVHSEQVCKREPMHWLQAK